MAYALALSTGCAITLAERKPDPPRVVHPEPEYVPVPPPPPPLPPRPAARKPRSAPPVVVEHKQIRGQALTVVRLDLRRVSPEFSFAYGTGKPLKRVESFEAMHRRVGPFVVASGTFFGVRNRETMGTIVSRGKIHQAPGWDNRGTALVIDRSGKGRMTTLRVEGKPDPRRAAFWMQAGPRLVRKKQIWYNPRVEGFRDPSLFSRARRMAVGLAGNGRTLLVVAFKEYPTLLEAATILRDLGVSDAMNLDGGPSAGLAVGGRVYLEPDSRLTHVLVMKPRDLRGSEAGNLGEQTFHHEGVRQPAAL
ncbi:MAG: phosphodiester glycosidase family protein [Candidatus Sericytochromatia bacterium]|nr:phosphodiester glycosidase family protein [Candidatus Tanganyikabacteria bacterium]